MTSETSSTEPALDACLSPAEIENPPIRVISMAQAGVKFCSPIDAACRVSRTCLHEPQRLAVRAWTFVCIRGIRAVCKRTRLPEVAARTCKSTKQFYFCAQALHGLELSSQNYHRMRIDVLLEGQHYLRFKTNKTARIALSGLLATLCLPIYMPTSQSGEWPT